MRIVLLLLLLLLHATVAWALRRRVTRGQPLAVAAQLLLVEGYPSERHATATAADAIAARARAEGARECAVRPATASACSGGGLAAANAAVACAGTRGVVGGGRTFVVVVGLD